MRHLQCQESQVFRLYSFCTTFWGNPQKQTPFPQKRKSPKTAKQAFHFWETRIPILQALPKPNPQKSAPKNGFGENLPVQGQPRLSSKGNLAYPRPIFPKNNTEAKYTGKLSLWFKPYWHLIPLNPSIFKAFSLHPSNLKWPHRKESSSLQGHLNLLYSLFGAAPDCPHRIIRCASGYGEIDLVRVL